MSEFKSLIDEALESSEGDRLNEQLVKANIRLSEAKSREKTAIKRAQKAEDIRDAVFNLRKPALDIPTWIIKQRKPSKTLHTPVLITSDFQWGEVIDEANMDGINVFDVQEAQRRYRLLIDRAIDLSINHLPNNRYDGMILLRLGDTVSGDIHDDLRESNELPAISAVRSVVESELWGIRQLADRFKKVHVVSVPGNHGRYQKKPPTKKIQNNYDTLAAWWLESVLAGDSRITWQTPDSTDAVFEIHGRKYLATHGDNIGSRGGQGFIGPAATIMRGMKKTMDEYARRGISINKMFVGHFHTAYDLGYGWSNGSLPGYSEFARVNRMTPEPPLQWLIIFHPKYGATSQWKIALAAEPTGSASTKPFEG